MTRLAFAVAGAPVQQGSKSVFRGRPVDANSKTLKPWRNTVKGVAATAMQVQGATQFAGPLRVALRFSMPRGKTVTREWPETTPDLDKLTRAVLDALTDAHVFGDDKQVVALDVIETYSPVPGVEVVVSLIQPNALAMWRARNER